MLCSWAPISGPSLRKAELAPEAPGSFLVYLSLGPFSYTSAFLSSLFFFLFFFSFYFFLKTESFLLRAVSQMSHRMHLTFLQTLKTQTEIMYSVSPLGPSAGTHNRTLSAHLSDLCPSNPFFWGTASVLMLAIPISPNQPFFIAKSSHKIFPEYYILKGFTDLEHNLTFQIGRAHV